MESNKISLMSMLLVILSCSCKDSQLIKNEKNIQNIKAGMSITDVKQMMGKPDEIINFKSEPNMFRYMYKAPLGASDNFYVMFSSADSTVLSVNYGR